MLRILKCCRCGHRWPSRGDPAICPKCKSPYYRTPRLSKKARLEIQTRAGRKGRREQLKKPKTQTWRKAKATMKAGDFIIEDGQPIGIAAGRRGRS